MEERQEAAIAAYHLTVRKKYRSRGGWMLETGQGPKLLREYENVSGHFEVENAIKDFLYEKGFERTDRVVPNGKGELVTVLETGEKYVVYNWFSGEECNLRNQEYLRVAGENLGRLHRMLRDFRLPENDAAVDTCGKSAKEAEDLLELFQRHNRELKRVNSYMKNKKKKTEFEIYAVNCFEGYYQTACEAARRLGDSSFYRNIKEEGYCICHGDYNYHNLIMTPGGTATIGFEKAGYGIYLQDLTYFMRKTMEKNGWHKGAGQAVLEGYASGGQLSQEMLEFVYIMLMYPEKYWKLMNHYFNKKKSWLSARSLEKLQNLRSQEKSREEFLHSFDAKY